MNVQEVNRKQEGKEAQAFLDKHGQLLLEVASKELDGMMKKRAPWKRLGPFYDRFGAFMECILELEPLIMPSPPPVPPEHFNCRCAWLPPLRTVPCRPAAAPFDWSRVLGSQIVKLLDKVFCVLHDGRVFWCTLESWEKGPGPAWKELREVEEDRA